MTLVDEAVMSYPVLAVGLAELFVIATVYGEFSSLDTDMETLPPLTHRYNF